MNTLRIAAPLFAAALLAQTAAAAIPRPEHPRPDFRRAEWLNLNGEWQFAFDPDGVGEDRQWWLPGARVWDRTINVPYPWESPLSGVERPDYNGTAWYRRTVRVPSEWIDSPVRGQVFLNFCAVDWSAKVWIGDQFVGSHEGGYTPFSFPVTEYLRDGMDHDLTVMVTDTTSPEQPVGKQIGWYTTTSGIWQTVYLEVRGRDFAYLADDTTPHIEDIAIETALDGNVSVRVTPSDPTENLRAEILPDDPADGDGVSAAIDPQWVSWSGTDPLSGVIQIPEPKLWSPESPALYFVKVKLYNPEFPQLADTVHTYFGIREVSRSKHADNPYEYIDLNGEPFYIRSALNQSFHPDGIHTFPSADVIRQDILDTKEFGLNNLRIHIKADEPLLYYWADRLGVTILYDLPCFRKYTHTARMNFEATLRESIARDKNHPSILAWVIFNETWGLEQQHTREGQLWVMDMFQLAKELDPTRLVEDNSPCNYDHIVTDINSWHFYIYDHARARAHIEEVVEKTFPGSNFNYLEGYVQGTEPLMNSEYGGVSAGMGDRDISWCFHYLTQELRRHQKICGYIYTELQDIEWEHNGFMDYDRSRKVFGYKEFVPVPDGHQPFELTDLTGANFLVLDAMAGQSLAGAERCEVPVSLSLYDHESEAATLSWVVYESDESDPQWKKTAEGKRDIEAARYAVTPLDSIAFDVVPGRLYILYAWAAGPDGGMAARNFWAFHSLGESQPVVEADGKTRVRWNPNDTKATGGEPETGKAENPEALALTGPAMASYEIALPEGIDWDAAGSAALRCELAACAGHERVDWKQRIRRPSTPQTDANNQFPSTVVAEINGETVAEIELPNDPADYRGFLSNAFESAPPSSYGYLQEIQVPLDLLKGRETVKVVFKTKEGTEGGLRVFGPRSGRYPIGPELVIQ